MLPHYGSHTREHGAQLAAHLGHDRRLCDLYICANVATRVASIKVGFASHWPDLER